MSDDNEYRWTMWIWLACLGLGAAFTAVAAKLATYVVNGKYEMNRLDSIDSTDSNDKPKIDISGGS